jgi:ABC-2 type transport system ATP-binding protein
VLLVSSEQPAVEICNIGKRYSSGTLLRRESRLNVKRVINVLLDRGERDIVALDDVSFKVEHGSVFGLLGANGAGKTTLMKILSTLVLPDSGRAFVYGVNVVRNPRRTTRMLQGVLAEGIGFERRLSGRANLDLFAMLYGLSKQEARSRIDELLAFSGLSDKGDIMFQKYSTGMSRKLLVCRALLSDASVLLFDEPTSGLDPVSAVEFRKLMKNILSKERGKTIILSTHNLWEAQQICDKMALLRKGKLIMTGTPDEVKQTVADKVSMSIVVTGNFGSWLDLVRELKTIDGVTNVEAVEKGSLGEMMLHIDGTKDINYTKIFETLSLRHLTITYLESTQPSLEEAFITLVKKNA